MYDCLSLGLSELMNKLEYISLVTSSVHDAVEGWARSLLRDAGIETTEVYGQFPPEGSVASHIVLFPYRLGTGDAQLARPRNTVKLLLVSSSQLPSARTKTTILPPVCRISGNIAVVTRATPHTFTSIN